MSSNRAENYAKASSFLDGAKTVWHPEGVETRDQAATASSESSGFASVSVPRRSGSILLSGIVPSLLARPIGRVFPCDRSPQLST